MNAIDRFWAKVRKLDGDSCWEWTAARNKHRYGMFWDGEKMVLAHRFAFALTNGADDVEDVCHRCDNPPCVRPDHLFGGTHTENVRDMVHKGRQCTPIGEGNPNARLAFDEVLELRRRHEGGEDIASLARSFGISWNSAKRIAIGRVRRSA